MYPLHVRTISSTNCLTAFYKEISFHHCTCITMSKYLGDLLVETIRSHPQGLDFRIIFNVAFSQRSLLLHNGYLNLKWLVNCNETLYIVMPVNCSFFSCRFIRGGARNMFQRCSVMLVRCNIILLLASWCSAVFINPTLIYDIVITDMYCYQSHGIRNSQVDNR